MTETEKRERESHGDGERAPKNARRGRRERTERGNEASEQTERASIFAGLDAATEGDAPLLANTTAKPGACRSRAPARTHARIHRPRLCERSRTCYDEVHSRGGQCVALARLCANDAAARARTHLRLCTCTGVSAQRGDRRPGPTRERSTLTSPNDRRRCTFLLPYHVVCSLGPHSTHRTLLAKSRGRIRPKFASTMASAGARRNSRSVAILLA